MSIFKRLLLISPFLIASYFLISSQLSDEGCDNFIETVFFFIKLIICFVFFVYAVTVSLRKRESEKLKVEPISGMIILSMFIVVFISIAYKDIFIGKIIFEAESKKSTSEYSTQKLNFRSNNRVTYIEQNIEYGCYKTFNYYTSNDTIILENEIELAKNLKTSKKYFKCKTRLLPINSSNNIDTISNYISFTIDSKSN